MRTAALPPPIFYVHGCISSIAPSNEPPCVPRGLPTNGAAVAAVAGRFVPVASALASHVSFFVLKHTAESQSTTPLARCPWQVLNLLLDMPGGFAEVLLERGCLPRILQLVELQLVRQEFHDGYVGAQGHACSAVAGRASVQHGFG